LKNMEGYEGEMSSLRVLELLEGLADAQCPVNVCKVCNHPYHLDYTTRYLNTPENYAAGIDSHCLSCWLDVGPGNGTIESLSEQSPLVSWALAFCEAAEPLKGVSRIPDPAALISVLQSIEVKLHQSTHAIEGHLPNQERAKQLTNRVLNMIDSYTKHLVSDFQLITNVISATKALGGELKLKLTVRNKGRVPLRDVRFSINPPMSAVVPTDIAFFPSGNVFELEFEGSDLSYSDNAAASKWANPHWTLNWTARNLAGKLIVDKRELGIDFLQTEANQFAVVERPEAPLGDSPYITGNAVKTDRNDVFVGRDQLLADIRNVIGHSGNVVLLEGNKRAGKSSVLWHLEGCQSIPGWIAVYVSFHGSEGDSEEKTKGIPTVEVFRHVATEAAKSIRGHIGEVLLPNGAVLKRGKPGIVDIVRAAIRDDAPFTYFREYLEVLLDWLNSHNLRLLLLLDEFDKLQEGIDSGITSPQVPENLRFMLQSDSRLTAILTSTKRLRRIREEYFSALYGLGTPFDVTCLSMDAAESLVTKPVKGQLVYAPNAIKRAVHLVARQPYLLQCLSECIFRAAKSSGVRSITIDHVNDAAFEVLKNRHFNDLFKYARTERRRFILALCHREENGPDLLRLAVIREKLSAHGIEVSEEELTADLEWLTDLELLDFSGANGGECYSLTIPLMGLWIDTLDYTGLMSKARAESAETEQLEDE
jgi:type I restriction enzyme M protein